MTFSANHNDSHPPRRTRAKPSGNRLSAAEVSIAKGMVLRGDRQHDVAAYFGVNPGRIAEISTGERFGEIQVASVAALPPVGPYARPSDLNAAREAIVAARQALAHAEQLIISQSRPVR